jgi:hypothetical protein
VFGRRLAAEATAAAGLRAHRDPADSPARLHMITNPAGRFHESGHL